MRKQRRTWVWVGVLLAYILCTLVMTWPAVARLSTHLIGDGDDMWVHYWNNWWVKRTLQQGADSYRTDLLFYPTGVSLRHQNFAWVNILLWLTLEPITGGIAAYNLVHLIHIPLCGLMMFLFVRRLTKSHAAAFVSGLVFAFWPFRMLDTNHPNMVSTEGFPLLMLLLWRLFHDEKPIRDGLAAGAVLALIGYMRWQLLILAGFMVALYVLYSLVWERDRWTGRVVAALLALAMLASVLMAPGIYPLVREQLASGLPDEVYTVRVSEPEQDLLAWLIPQHQHVLGDVFTSLFTGYGQTPPRQRYSAYLGCAAVGLAILGVLKRRRQPEVWFWFTLALLCLAFAVGPYLRFNDREYPVVPLPYRLVGWFPPVQMLGPPRRFNALLGVPVAVLVGHGVRVLGEWLSRRRWGMWLARPAILSGLLGLVILVDYFCVPTATVSAHVPAFYSTLDEDAGDAAIVGLPGSRHATEYYMFYQTAHGHPILGGHVSRLPPQALDYEASVPLLTGMYKSDTGRLNTDVPDISRQLSSLAESGFDYIVMHKDLSRPGLVPEWQSYLAVSPVYEDGEVAAYTTQPVVGQDCFLKHDFGTGIGLIQAELSEGHTAVGPVLQLEFVWGTTVSPGQDLHVEVALVNAEGDVAQVQDSPISPAWPTGDWPANTIVRDHVAFQIEPKLEEGVYSVIVGLASSDGGQEVGRRVEVGHAVLQMTAQGLRLFPMAYTTAVDLGPLRLLGYNVEAERSQVGVVLHWQALQQMEMAYKFFVHLVDARSGTLVAQVDFMPWDWTYPTSEWTPGQVVSDEIAISLRGIPAGEYQLWLGVYHPDSGQRLAIGSVPDGFEVSEGRMRLPEDVSR